LGNKATSFSASSADEDKKSLKRGQRAQRSFPEGRLAVLAFRETLEMGPLFLHNLSLDLLAVFTSATSAVKSFMAAEG
jgi:hypothetical protein